MNKALIILIIALFAAGCSKSNSIDLENGETVVNVDFKGIGDNSNDLNNAKEAAIGVKMSAINPVSENQVMSVPVGNGLYAVATLSPVTTSQVESISSKSKIASTTTTNQVNNKEIAVGTKIKMLAYNKAGDLVEEKEYSYANFDQTNKADLQFTKLIVGETYTFLVFSNNTSTASPVITGKSKLSTTFANNVTTEFLYFKKQLTINQGINFLEVTLRHQHSQVSATININQSGDLKGSKLINIGSSSVLPAFTSSSIQLSENKKTYNNQLTNGTPLTFNIDPTGVKAQSNNAFIISDGANSTFRLGGVTINGFTKSLDLTGFNVLPGVRYTLNVEIGAPCTAEVPNSGEIVIQNHSDKAKETAFTFDAADYGFTLDIYKLDNSFNLKVNNKFIFEGKHNKTKTNEINFQGFGRYPNTDKFPNIEFADGDRWGVTKNQFVDEVFDMNGNSSTVKQPILKIVVDREGNVQMFGSKKVTGGAPFYPLKLINNQDLTISGVTKRITGAFNTVTWYADRKNEVVLSQQIQDNTSFYGRISGVKKVPCTVAP